MSQTDCYKQPSVLEAVRSGFCPPELREHISGCDACADSAAVAGFLLNLGHGDAGTGMPSASHLWWKLRLRARREALEQVRRPLSVLQWAMSVALILAAGCAVAWQWDAVCTWSGFLAKAVSSNAAPARDFARNLWLSWKFILLAGAGAIATVAAVVAWLVHPQD